MAAVAQLMIIHSYVALLMARLLLLNLPHHTNSIHIPIHLCPGNRHASSHRLECFIAHVCINIFEPGLQRRLGALEKLSVRLYLYKIL
jgi:hypothetical protein